MLNADRRLAKVRNALPEDGSFGILHVTETASIGI